MTPPAGPPPLTLLVLDQDAGATLPDGGRAGAILRAQQTGAGWSAPAIAASDPRWVEPTDLLQLPDGPWLLLESHWAPGGDAGPEARGAIFRLSSLDAAPELWWTDARARQPVALVRDDEGTLFVSDRDADPLGLRAAEPGRKTGCVFGIEVGPDGRPARTEIVAAGPELFTPGALFASGSMLLLMDADANPHGIKRPDGVLATPGVLFDLLRLPKTERLAPRHLHALLDSVSTVSPVGLIERRRPGDPAPPAAGEGSESWTPGRLVEFQITQARAQSALPDLYLVDANFGTAEGVLGDGAILRLTFMQVPDGGMDQDSWIGRIVRCDLVADTRRLGAHALVDPTTGCCLPDGRLAIADANADPRHLGPDGTNKGVYGTAHGAVVAWDPDAPAHLEVLLAGDAFVTPVAVRVVQPAGASR
ncbi:MAG TPA: hypothetical protein VFY71_03945 [Planctomycetota bacterium]|nr:hypothetical protein [Planctomycetota bacterium]